jgi:hypothetical protein
MRLKSFGCSFIFGSDLTDSTAIPGLRIIPSQTTWPAQLAKHLGYEYECYARPGSGNLQISERILNQVADSSPTDLFVINWTWIDRFDYVDCNSKWPGLTAWSTIMPANNNELAKMYYRDLHSEYRDKFTSLSCIKLVIDTLEQKGIPFIMTYMDPLMFDQQWHITPAVNDLQQYIQPHMTTFDGQTFLDWSRKNNYPVSESWHPLDEAHRVAGDYLYINFKEKYHE